MKQAYIIASDVTFYDFEEEINLKVVSLIFNKRNIDYCPIGITDIQETIDFVKYEVNKLILHL